MENRFRNILTLLSESGYHEYMAGVYGSPYVIEGFKEIGENAFQLEVGLTPLGSIPFPDNPFANLRKRDDIMILLYHAPYPGQDVFTIQIRYVFGALDTNGMNLESASRQFLAFLDQNVGSFFATGAYIGIKREGNMMYAYLEMMLHFLVEWSDDQIVRVLSFQLAGMYKGLENNWDDSLTILKRF